MSDEQSERRVQQVRDGLDAFRRGDGDAVLAFFSEDVEIYSPPEAGNAGTFHGHDGYEQWLAQWLEAWEGFEVEAQRIEPVGERHVVAETFQTARGRGSGVPVEQRMSYVFDLRGGKVVAFQLYPDWDVAVEVARRRERGAA